VGKFIPDSIKKMFTGQEKSFYQTSNTPNNTGQIFMNTSTGSVFNRPTGTLSPKSYPQQIPNLQNKALFMPTIFFNPLDCGKSNNCPKINEGCQIPTHLVSGTHQTVANCLPEKPFEPQLQDRIFLTKTNTDYILQIQQELTALKTQVNRLGSLLKPDEEVLKRED
jgi:hypothetical protein